MYHDPLGNAFVSTVVGGSLEMDGAAGRARLSTWVVVARTL
jgi:hypothetical protein